MMICPQTFVEEFKDYTYEQLIEVRNELLKEMLDFEQDAKRGGLDTATDMIHPSPEVVYQMNQDYLMELLDLMRNKYMTYSDFIDAASEEEQLEYIRNILIFKHEYVSDNAIKKAKSLLNKLCKKGNGEALNIKGSMYYEGNGVKQDQNKAVSLYKKAADAGCSIAMSNLGYAFFYGNGTPQNYEKAYLYFTMAQQRGEWDAFNKLGDMYREGLYVPKDECMAFSLYDHCYRQVPHDATTEAYPACLVRLGECFYKGIGITVNHIIAKNLLEESQAIFEQQIEEGNFYAKLCIDRVRKALEELSELSAEVDCMLQVFDEND